MMKEKLRKIKAYIAQFHSQVILVVIALLILDLIVSSLVRNFVPRKKSKNHHAALNRISF